MNHHRRSIDKAISELNIAREIDPIYSEDMLVAAARHVQDALNYTRRVKNVGNRRVGDVSAAAGCDVGHGQ